MEEIEVIYPTSLAVWRKWLEKNHLLKNAVWVIFYRKSAGKKTITWSEAVDVALCFGWIDSKKIKIDEEASKQFFSKRKPVSTWSRINKEKVELLIESGLMTAPGLQAIEIAKQNGSWTLLDEVEELLIPEDLEAAFSERPMAKAYFLRLSKSVRKAILQWLVLARRPETRQKRIAEIIERADQQLKPRHLQ